MGVRNVAKAIIVRDGKILLNWGYNTFKEGLWGLSLGAVTRGLPGGGQNQFESLEETVKRECLEETGYVVKVDKLGAIFEEISANKDYRLCYKDYAHKIHFVFVCFLESEVALAPAEKDAGVVGLEWVDIEKLEEITLLPRAVHGKLFRILQEDGVVYLGSELVP